MGNLRVLFFAFLVLASPFLQGARCQSHPEHSATEVADAGEGGEVGIIDEDAQDVLDLGLSQLLGLKPFAFSLKTVKNETELLVGMKNEGQSSLDVVAVKGSVHLPFDHRLLVQNLTAMTFNNTSVPTSAQATCCPGRLILLAPSFARLMVSHTKTSFTMAPLKLLSLEILSAWSQFFLLALGLHSFFSLDYGSRVDYSVLQSLTALRKPRRLRKLRWELQLERPPSMNGLRELLTPNHCLANRRRSKVNTS